MLKDEKVREALDLEALRRREVQMMGAAISTRSWHDMENAYNQLRDKIDGELSRRARAALSPPPAQAEASTLPGEVVVSRTRAALIEACAKIAETLPIGGGTLSSWINTNESPMGATRRHIATAIRAYATPPTTPAVESESADRGVVDWRAECEWLLDLDEIHVGEGETEILERIWRIRAALAAINGETT